MTTTSYPAVGDNGFDEAEWQKMHDSEDGVINDFTGGGSLALTINSGANTATVDLGVGRVNGFHLEVTVAEALSVSTTAATYYIAIQYDPALNVADGSGDADPLGPCRLVINTTLDTAGGKKYLILYSIVRAASQALSAATLTDLRVWMGPTKYMKAMPAAALAETAIPGFGPFSLGTQIITEAGEVYRRVPGATVGTAAWTNAGSSSPVAFPVTGSLVALDAAAAYTVENGRVFMRGTLKRTTGNLSTGSNVILGTMPVGFRPVSIRRFVCYGNGVGSAQVIAPVKIDSAGVLTMYNPPDAVVAIDLSAINYSIRS